MRDPSQIVDESPDVAPLAWVLDEIRAALGRATTGIQVFLGSKDDVDSLRAARAQIHEANGAVQMLDLRGVVQVLDAVEQLLRYWEAEPRECLPAAVRSVESALSAVIAFLESMQAGRPNQPIRLFPYYRDILVLSHAPRVHAADLLFPDLSRRPAFHGISIRSLTPDQLRVRRVHFETGLLGFLRNPNDFDARGMMRDALIDLENMPQRGLARSFWWVVRGLMDALAADHLPLDVDLKRVLARLNLQLRRAIEGGGAVAERLMTDALYYVGRAAPGEPRVAEIKRLYGLEALIPPDFERPTLTSIDPEQLRALKEALAQAKALWGPLAGGTSNDAAGFLHEIHAARRAAGRIAAHAIDIVLETIGSLAGDLGALSASVRETLGIEIASALLFIDLGVDELPHTDQKFEGRARAVAERLMAARNDQPLPDLGPWLTELARRAQDRLTMSTVVAETQATLREVEQRLDRYFRQPAEREELAATPAKLDQIAGVLSLLGHDDAVAAVRDAQRTIERFAQPDFSASETEFGRVAGNLGAIGFFVEALGRDADRTGGMFRWDADAGVFSADLALLQPDQGAAIRDGEAGPITRMPGAAGENVESAVRRHVEQAQRLAQQLAGGEAAALGEFAHLLPQLSNDADLLDDDALKQRAARAAVLVKQLQQVSNPASVEELLQIFAAPAAPAPAPAALPASEAAADAELLGIFVEEAGEVLDTIDEQLGRLAAAPTDHATMTTTRRAFHTLKGSSRMVGLASFGEAAWSIEQCFNLWLSQERAASEDLIKLAAAARTRMREWLAQIAADPRSPIDADALVHAADQVRAGGSFADADLGLPAATEAKRADAVAAPAAAVAGEAEQYVLDVPEFEFEISAPAEEPSPTPPAALAAEAPDEIRRIGPVAISHGLYAVFLNESDECIRALAQDVSEWRYEPQRPASALALRRAHSLAGITATVGIEPVLAIAHPLDDLLRELSEAGGPNAVLAPAQFDTLERVIERMRGMLHQFAAGVYPDAAPLEAAAVQELLGVVRAQTALRLQEAEADEAWFVEESSAAPSGAVPPAAGEPVAPAVRAAREDEQPASNQTDVPIGEPTIAPAEAAAAAATVSESAPRGHETAAAAVQDDVDPELLPIFLTEGADLLPAIGAGLRALAARPNDRDVVRELMRHLHTVKGSARMTGAMRLGELVHDMETRIEASMQLPEAPAALIEDLLVAYDEVMARFDALQATPATDAAPTAATEPPESAETAAVEEPVAAVPTAAPASTFIRVRADVLDKLVDHAGEVSIARAKLENEVAILRSSLVDLIENIQRLRSQLREVEIQADAQIQARSDQLSRESAAFDALEYDRYTRLQELTRMLRETVEDVALVQGNMLKGLQTADADLMSQGRLTRELQRQLMHVRLVTFANISERLHRVARQAAKELDKQVNVDIRGADTEIDRGVLEKMAGPFEHLVRNAVAHGIEPSAARRAAGKAETGTIRIDVRQEANEVIIVLADDGAGLDLDRIRARAHALGLIAPDHNPSERELMDLIFAPGFSTATDVTELAGRGVGLDVVRSELASFGGRMAVATERGRGTRFTLYLPLTLAVMQVVLARVGPRRYAVPSGMVEQVLQYRPSELAHSISEGMLDVPGLGPVVLRQLAQLLGEEILFGHVKQIPVLLLRSGDDRLAIVADEVSNNQEIVVKSVGANVSRLAGVLGATIMGNGEIVLIINPVQLIARAPEPPTAAETHLAISGGDESLESAEQAAAQVMVVDDSLTVRRVTQRLLERYGYEVLQAKDGVDALRQLQEDRPDLMLIDIEMPRMDGFELTRNIRGNPATRDIPIIMITSRTAEKHRRLAFEIGVNEYLGKPYQEDELIALLRQYLALRVPQTSA